MAPGMFIFTAGSTDWYTAIKNRVKIPWPQERKYGVKTSPLLYLPNEILENVALFLVPQDIEVMEGTDHVALQEASEDTIDFHGGRSQQCQDLIKDRFNLRSLALACRRLRPIVERVLY
jgi:hypothetical protein